MYEVKVLSGYRITIPKVIREQCKLVAGDKLYVKALNDTEFIVSRKPPVQAPGQ